MAANPSFIGTPRMGVGSITTGQTSRTAGTPANIVDVISAGSDGTRVLEVVVISDGDPADSVVILWLHDGSNSTTFDEFDIGNPAAASNTAVGYRLSTTYPNLVLPTGWKLQATCTVTPTTGTIKVWALGGDL